VIAKGILAGAAGTAAMTIHQTIRQRLSESDAGSDAAGAGGSDQTADPWRTAPAPAQVGKRLIGALTGAQLSPGAIPALTQVMHWSYASSWGVGYALARRTLRARPRLLGPGFGVFVWVMSYVQLVPLGIYDPPWRYPPGAVADEVAYHLTYGASLALAYRLL
jgi:hypothetical protein